MGRPYDGFGPLAENPISGLEGGGGFWRTHQTFSTLFLTSVIWQRASQKEEDLPP